MSLPGKLCVGILEEDNPLRSYFRFKPLLLDEGGVYVPFEGEKPYPDEGCIRIVPDKNESFHFKTRMRQMGLFSVVDLREHPNDNDKIRPNKNYRPEGEEVNACIIYSDVVRAPAPGMIFEVLPADAAQGPVRTPRTSVVLLEKDGAVDPVCHIWEAVDGEDKAVLRATPALCPLDTLQVFELPGFRGESLRFAIRTAGSMDAVCDAPEKPARAEKSAEPVKPVPERPAPEKPADKAEPVKPSPKEAPSGPRQVEAEKPAAPAAPEKPATAKEAAKSAPVAPVAPVEPATPNPPAPPETDPEKPWIHHDESIMPRPINPHLSRTEQLRAAQAGLNPRRGRSLQELIDEKWAHSRLNQLGMSASPIVTGAPLRNPVDAAVESLREAWSQPDLRRPLLDKLSQVDDFLDSLRKFREQAGLNLVEAQLNGLEAQRLELLSEIDKLKANGRSVRDQLKQEIRQDDAAELADAQEKTRAAKAELARYEQMASDARSAAKDARGLLDDLVGDQLEQKIRDVALIRRVEERLRLLRDAAEDEPALVNPDKIDINAFIERVTRRFAAEGWSLTRLDAANLCVCLVISPTLTLSGAPGSGKTAAARMLADALGLSGAGRAVVVPPMGRHGPHNRQVDKLRKTPELPAMVILDDANLSPAPDALRGMGQVFDPEWRTVLTVQDAHTGAPLNAAALDRGFMVRLAVPDSLAWTPIQRKPAPAYAPASMQIALPQAQLPAAIVERMKLLRGAMAKRGVSVSRRALDDAWRYCAAMLAILGDDADAEQLFDMAFAQRILPVLLATAPIEAAVELRRLTEKMPVCRGLLRQPLPILIG